jgi:hypothetical protein
VLYLHFRALRGRAFKTGSPPISVIRPGATGMARSRRDRAYVGLPRQPHDIADLVSELDYNESLINISGLDQRLQNINIKTYNAANFKIDKNITYFDIRKGAVQKNNRGSNFNLLNVFFVIERIIEILKLKRFKLEEIVILSLYLIQLAIYVKALRKIHEKYSNSKYNGIRIFSIEKFQKLKVEIVFFDIIFTNKIDFLRNFIIILFRAKYGLYLIFNVKDIENYSRNNFWKRLISKIKKIKTFYVYYNNLYSK